MPAEESRLRQTGERLQKVLAQAGVASRRKCEEIIVAGRVRVNGKVVTELGTRVRPDIDIVDLDGSPVVAQERHYVYYLLYKPTGYLSTVSDPHSRQTALSLVPNEDEERLYPVGRLDLESEGLLLFTNDGDLAYRLMHPRFAHEKEYLVQVQGSLAEDDLARLQAGVHIDEAGTFARAEARRLAPDHRWRREPNPPGSTWLQVILREGRKRQIRLMLDQIGYPVLRLIRVRMGPLTLGALNPGKGRWLSHSEAQALRQFAGLEKPYVSRKDLRTTAYYERKERLEKDHDRHRRPGGLGQEHRRRRAGG